jgi:hypothetical protein
MQAKAQLSNTDFRDWVRRRLHLPEHRGHFASRLLYLGKADIGRACVEIVGLNAFDLDRNLRSGMKRTRSDAKRVSSSTVW